ncbi:hypothetical protein F4X10_21535 [Candidatus Poribacteria bacterium]|nr:hypothetical protein [Candidatus Poribacteria bacterium]
MYSIDDWKDRLKKRFTFNTQQETIAIDPPPATKFRRVKGTAGSGKSLALAARAAVLASQGKRVLVCSHNIALLNYLEEDLVKQFVNPIPLKITFMHFHLWCRSVCEATESMNRYDQLWNDYPNKQEVWNYGMGELVSRLYDEDIPNLPTYDAILLDEGHDFRIDWWITLKKAITQGGEALFVCDKTQNIHGTAQAWTEQEMRGCGFTGAWMELRKSYRLTNNIIPILKNFYNQFPYEVGHEGPDIPEQDPSYGTEVWDNLRWVQVHPGRSPIDACIKEIERLHDDPAIPFVNFLSGKKIGIPIVGEFKRRDKNIFSTHHEDWRISREAKLNLSPGCAEIVATTVHSFKGWETPYLIVHVEQIRSLEDRAAFYTALSRLKRNNNGAVLTVVSSCPELEQFGRENFRDFKI